jgi:GNAT superfamily N-acetyltransferase
VPRKILKKAPRRVQPVAKRLPEAAPYQVRRATLNDVAMIAHHRVAMFQDMGLVASNAQATTLFELSTGALATVLSDGSYVGWLASDAGGTVVGGAGAHIKPHLPRISPDGTYVATSPVPLVVNVYTEVPHRGKGVARTLMNALIAWAEAEGFDRVVLHASDMGRGLYASLGFNPTNEMRLSIGGPEGD